MKVAIIGASGFTGLELIKMVHTHPRFVLHTVATTSGDDTIDSLHPALKDVILGEVEKVDLDQIGESCDLIFLAVPHKTAMDLVKQLMHYDCKIVDLSADYRLELERYEKNYCPHTDPEHLKDAVYGLPELNGEAIKKARLVANPGCYPTSAILAIAPFSSYLSEDRSVIVDAKSGVSGAGKKCSETTHFVSIHENLFAYNPLGHRHGPEIEEKVSILSQRAIKVHFVPHLVPVTRGMLSSVYLELNQDIDAKAVLEAFYKDHYFVRIVESPAQMKRVAGTNFCDIYIKQEGQTLFLSSAIDNLLRGASSQAMVNANLMCGFDANMGVPTLAYAP